MNWYIAKIVYRIICGDGDHTAQFDEQLRLISAFNKAEAFDRSIALGKMEEDNFYNHDKLLVRWEFVNVLELYELNDLVDGAEIYSRIKEVNDGEGYSTFVHKKSAAIFDKQKISLLN
ncbi:MAG: DUF4288 domain-containing protein [Ferruginibacter sp.]